MLEPDSKVHADAIALPQFSNESTLRAWEAWALRFSVCRRGRVPVYITASHLDGVVLAPTFNSYSYNYRSNMLFAHASVFEEPDERLYAMQLMTG
ncbi:hypothetical protein LY76DRAFT_641420 [Colletotrichum caudatum]|nr:hypothetical protein LY76DRAFT_641420 [Colletotrichum caudatum]